MSTTVLLRVTPRAPTDPDTVPADPLPADLVDAFVSAGQPTAHGFARRGGEPWQWSFQLSGPDRARAGQVLRSELARLGYDVELCTMR